MLLHVINGHLEIVRISPARRNEVAQDPLCFRRGPTERSSGYAEMKNRVRGAVDQTPVLS
jgi:hypothetical protein